MILKIAKRTSSLKQGYRILSSYRVGGKAIWIITEADRSVTTVLLPEDYWVPCAFCGEGYRWMDKLPEL